ncbi:MAG: hypothetical protein NC395_05705 [Prevotella sp.]|nr:hypothetical protein [Prevotella sp.]
MPKPYKSQKIMSCTATALLPAACGNSILNTRKISYTIPMTAPSTTESRKNAVCCDTVKKVSICKKLTPLFVIWLSE